MCGRADAAGEDRLVTAGVDPAGPGKPLHVESATRIGFGVDRAVSTTVVSDVESTTLALVPSPRALASASRSTSRPASTSSRPTTFPLSTTGVDVETTQVRVCADTYGRCWCTEPAGIAAASV